MCAGVKYSACMKFTAYVRSDDEKETLPVRTVSPVIGYYQWILLSCGVRSKTSVDLKTAMCRCLCLLSGIVRDGLTDLLYYKRIDC